MVLPGSRRVSRAPRYLGYRFESVELSLTWLSHSLALLSRRVQLAHGLVTLLTRPYNPQPCTRRSVATARFFVPWAVCRIAPYKPTTPTTCRGYSNIPCRAGFRLFRFRSPLLSESLIAFSSS